MTVWQAAGRASANRIRQGKHAAHAPDAFAKNGSPVSQPACSSGGPANGCALLAPRRETNLLRAFLQNDNGPAMILQ
jgi:hypothetical protein